MRFYVESVTYRNYHNDWHFDILIPKVTFNFIFSFVIYKFITHPLFLTHGSLKLREKNLHVIILLNKFWQD